MLKKTVQHLICCRYGEWDDARSVPVLVAPSQATAQDIAGELKENPSSPYRQMALDALGDSVFPLDAEFSVQDISVLMEEPEKPDKELLTKDELIQKLRNGAKMEDLFDISPGQECEIFKTQQLIPGDKIIYIPDLSLNNIPTDRPVKDSEEIQEILHSCYTGDEFLEECDGDVEMAERLFCYCDWQHPDSAFPEIQDDYGE